MHVLCRLGDLFSVALGLPPDARLPAAAASPTLQGQRDFWNHWNATVRIPGQLNEWTLERGAAILEALRALGLHTPNIMDFGCGSGWLTEQLISFGPTTGVDLADAVIDEAQRRVPGAEFIAGDLFSIPLPRGRFDVVVSQDVIAHVPDQSGYLARAADILRPGGHLIITTTNRFVVTRMGLPVQPMEHIENWLTMGDLLKLLEARFAVRSRQTVTPLGSTGILRFTNAPMLARVLRPLCSADSLKRLKERLGLGYSMIAVAQKRSIA